MRRDQLIWVIVTLIVMLFLMDNSIFPRKKIIIKRVCASRGDDSIVEICPDYYLHKSSIENKEIGPKVVHLIKVDSNFVFFDFLVVYAILTYVRPDVFFYHVTDPNMNGCWWQLTKKFVVVRKIDPEKYKTMNGKNVTEKAHISDFFRVSILCECGGLYMDRDSLVVKSFDDLYKHDVVIGEQSGGSVAVGLMMSKKNSKLMCKFADLMPSYFSGKWTSHSVQLLSKIYQEEIQTNSTEDIVLMPQNAFFMKDWGATASDEFFIESRYPIPSDAYAVHLFGKFNRGRMEQATPSSLREKETSLVSRALLPILPKGLNDTHLSMSASECHILEQIFGIGSSQCETRYPNV